MKRTYWGLGALTVVGMAAVACTITKVPTGTPSTATPSPVSEPALVELPEETSARPESEAADDLRRLETIVAEPERLDESDVSYQTGALRAKASAPVTFHDVATSHLGGHVGGVGADRIVIPHGPLAEDRERYQDVDSNPLKLVSEEPVSTFSIDVDTAAYANVRRFLEDGVMPPVDAVRVEEMINYFDYAYAPPETSEQPFATDIALFGAPWDAGTQLLRIGIKGYEIESAERPPANLVFLIDTSGSMNSPDKLPLLQRSLRLLVEEMRDEDKIAIVAYAGSAGVVLEPTSGAERGDILRALDEFRAGGRTAGAAGIEEAYQLAEAEFDQDGINRVILATDGDFNVGMNDPDRLEDFIATKRKSGVYLSILGFGRGNLHDHLMQKLAQSGNGNAHYIDGLTEARKVLVDEMGSTLFPIADDVKIQIEFNPKRVAEYRLIGYETRMLEREDFNNDRIDAGEIGSGHRVTALYEITSPDSSSRLIDDLRYSLKDASHDRSAGSGDEVAWLRVRYKQPGEEESRMIEEPISAKRATAFDEASIDARFASAVAAFGEILRQSAHVENFDLDAVEDIARSARGDDPFGYRNEFLQLVRLAKSADRLHVTQR